MIKTDRKSKAKSDGNKSVIPPTTKIRSLVKQLEVLPSKALKDWEQGYVAGCSDSQDDKIEMLEWFASRVSIKKAA